MVPFGATCLRRSFFLHNLASYPEIHRGKLNKISNSRTLHMLQVIAICLLVLCFNQVPAQVKLVNLCKENFTNPIGIDNPHPRTLASLSTKMDRSFNINRKLPKVAWHSTCRTDLDVPGDHSLITNWN